MDFSFLDNMNWLAVLVAAIAYFALGAIWFSFLFQKQWIAHHNINMDDPGAKSGVAGVMAMSFVITIVIVLCLAILRNLLGITSVAAGAKLGMLTGIGFSMMAISMTYLYLKKPSALHFIDGLYHVFGQIIAGVILAAWA